MSKKTNFHSFVIMTGGNAKYLKRCILSLKKQKKKSHILIYTSQNSKKIKYYSKKFKIKLIQKKRINIANDWDNALRLSKSQWVTLVHDDDIYHKNYFEEVNKILKNPDSKDISIIFTNYLEIRNNQIQNRLNFLLFVKRFFLFMGFFYKNKISNKFLKKNILLFGSSIPCPSVTFNRKINKYKKFFNSNYKVNLDWDCWLRLSKKNNSFFWIKKNLFFHRIHKYSVTSKSIISGLRKKEDIKILKRIWPKYLAQFILKINSLAYTSNQK